MVKVFCLLRKGTGPVNALDNALRKDLGKYQAQIDDLELVDYKVRILNGGTEAITRVLIDSIDREGSRWTTVGVSDNIIDASFQALIDSINYKLMRAGVESCDCRAAYFIRQWSKAPTAFYHWHDAIHRTKYYFLHRTFCIWRRTQAAVADRLYFDLVSSGNLFVVDVHKQR
ncbi:(R)-citramalate synthase [Nymphon striatum]|nr:(R)-citramalate synthase [Nymphon striatum]